MRKSLLAATLLAFAGIAAAEPVRYDIDPGHTNVLASWSHLGFSNPSINFGQAKGTIVYDADDVSASSVEVTLPISGISALADQFFEHLTSGDWFDVAQYPEARFRSTAVAPAGEGRLKVTGDLTVKGVTRPVVLDVVLNGSGEHPMTKRPAIGFDATATLKRSEFGLGRYVPMVSDEVALRITTEASAKAAE
jgi:polyisoprenoid-binding protein YceI